MTRNYIRWARGYKSRCGMRVAASQDPIVSRAMALDVTDEKKGSRRTEYPQFKANDLDVSMAGITSSTLNSRSGFY